MRTGVQQVVYKYVDAGTRKFVRTSGAKSECEGIDVRVLYAREICSRFLAIRKVIEINGGQGRNRTADAGLFRAALYQLSYLARWLEKEA